MFQNWPNKPPPPPRTPVTSSSHQRNNFLWFATHACSGSLSPYVHKTMVEKDLRINAQHEYTKTKEIYYLLDGTIPDIGILLEQCRGTWALKCREGLCPPPNPQFVGRSLGSSSPLV